MNEFDNSFCEICLANPISENPFLISELYWINTHCIELRRNREVRKNKKINPKTTVF